jgi:hypothetical protein
MGMLLFGFGFEANDKILSRKFVAQFISSTEAARKKKDPPAQESKSITARNAHGTTVDRFTTRFP